MTFCLRRIYVDGQADPTELLHLRFASNVDIDAHLIAHLTPALISAYNAVARPRRTHLEPQRTTRHLTFLAGHLDHLRTTDLAWWHLYESVPFLKIARHRALVIGLLVWLMATAVYGL